MSAHPPAPDCVAPVAPLRPAGGHVHIFGLDVVRASAITLVVLSHMLGALEFLGILGVELFFVLSGYLVGGIFLRAILAREGLGKDGHYRALLFAFWKRRWARTLPNYFLFLLLSIPVFPQADHSWPQLLRYAVFAQNLWYPVGELFQISWSLAVEEWFYLILPGVTTLLLVVTRRAVPSIVAAVALLIVGCALLRLLPSIVDFNRGMRMVVVYRLDALAYGVAGALLAQLRPGVWRRLSQAWPVGLIGLVVLGLVLEKYQLRMDNLQATIVFALLPICALLLLARSVSLASRVGTAFGTGVGAVSKWSYSMYLSHIPIFFLLYDLPGYANYGGAAKLAVKAIGVGLILLVSALVYRWFEVPTLARLSPRQAPH